MYLFYIFKLLEEEEVRRGGSLRVVGVEVSVGVKSIEIEKPLNTCVKQNSENRLQTWKEKQGTKGQIPTSNEHI